MTAKPTYTVEQQIEDEDGWRMVTAIDPDDGGIWTIDKHGNERWERGT